MVRPVAEEYFSNGLDKDWLIERSLSKFIKLSSPTIIIEFSLIHKIVK